MNKTVTISNSVNDTIGIASLLASDFVGGEVVLLSGELGAGKTHFAKGIALGLEITDTVTSPTFALHNIYNGRLILNHFDFYRVEDEEEVVMLGLTDYFVADNAVSVIEWHSNIANLLPNKTINVTIVVLGQDSRMITIEG